MSDLRKAAEMALEALETLWDILDDIDTASDMAKENDAWYRKRVEALQKKRWDTMITTDGYKLKDGPVEALRQALAQDALQELADIDHSLGLFIDEPPKRSMSKEKPPVKSYCGGKPNYCTEVETIPDTDLEQAIKKGTKAWAGVDSTKWVDELRGGAEQEPEWIDDGFGTMWKKCGKKDCGKFVVKIGKVDCWNGDCPELKEKNNG